MSRLTVQPSPIHGLGVFAIDPISKGESLRDEVKELIKQVKRPGPWRFGGFNFSCRPNVTQHEGDKTFTPYAARDIAPGEELTCLWPFEGGWPGCNCEECRT